ncbi:DM13 domain [Trinorchestia longiramus]|nr:DM13 domain [Trinorchestia longiramus]
MMHAEFPATVMVIGVVNFGSFRVPPNLILPKKRKLAELSRLAHAVRSGNVTLLDSKTIYIPNLHYDGRGPDAYFWVGKGVPDRSGRKIPNEKKSLSPLESYEGVDIELVLPDNLTVYDIDYLALWCVKYTENFGDVKIPPASELFLPPALGQTQVKNESGLQPLQPGAKDQYHTTDEVYTTAQLPTSSEPVSVELSTIVTDLTLLNETSTQLPETAFTDSDKFSSNETEAGEVGNLESFVNESSTIVIMTQTDGILEFVTDDPLLTSSVTLELTTDNENLVSSTSEMSLETSTSDGPDLNTAESVENLQEVEDKNDEERNRKGRQMSKKKIEALSDDSKIGIKNLGGPEEVMSSDFYLATPDKERNYVFRYGKAEDLNNIMVFDTNKTQAISTTNTSGAILGDFGGMPDASLSENEYTFKYDADPEIEPVSRNVSEITEILVHEAGDRYRYSVGNDHVIQHIIDDVNFQPHGLVKIDSQKHSGAYFYGLPAHTDHESESLEHHSHEESDGPEETVMEEHHPKDVYSVQVHMDITESEAGKENPEDEKGGTGSEDEGTESPQEGSKKKEVTAKEKNGSEEKEGDESNEQIMEGKEKDTTKSVEDDTDKNVDENEEKRHQLEENVSESNEPAAKDGGSVSESKKAESAAPPNSIPDLIVLLVGVHFAAWQHI